MDDPDAVPELSACCRTCEPEASLESACSLTPEGLAERLAEMRALARQALLRAERHGLTLWLASRPDARAEVAELVSREAECCDFLHFRLEDERDRLLVTVTSADHAETAAGEIFDAFEGWAPQAREQVTTR